MTHTADIIIVGGGIMGTSLAYHLCRKGVRKVVLLEKQGLAGGSTCKSAAVVRMHYTNQMTVVMALRSRDLFLNWADRIGHHKVYWRSGWFFLTPPDQEAHVRKNLEMNCEQGVDASLADHDMLRERMPGINTDGLGLVVHESDSGYADPVGVCEGLARHAVDDGADVRTGVSVNALLVDGDRVTGVRAGHDTFEAPITVAAAGPWTHTLTGDIGLDLPLEITREQEVVLNPSDPTAAPPYAISNMADQFYLRPKPDGGLLIGRGYPKAYELVDPDHYEQDHDAAFARDVESRLAHRFPRLAGSTIRSGVVGLYTVTPDWHPILGPVERHPGLWLATGGSGHAFKIGPAIGEMLADMIVDGTCEWVDAGMFNLSRFETGQTFKSSYGGNRA